MPSPPGWREVPCVECGKFVAGIDFGERCPSCHTRRRARAYRIARIAALVATLLTAAWITFRPLASPTGRWAGIIAVPITYLLVRLVVGRIAMEVLP